MGWMMVGCGVEGWEGGFGTICYSIFIGTGKVKTITGGGAVNCIEVRDDGIGINMESTQRFIGTEHCVGSSVVPPFSSWYWYIQSYWYRI